MLTTAKRAYTEAELDEYSDRMETRRANSIALVVVMVVIAVIVGAVGTLITFAGYWLYALVTSGAAAWTVPLIVGGVVAALALIVLWIGFSGDMDWTERPPELATDVTATAYAGWLIESDRLDIPLLMRIEADCYLLVNEDGWMPVITDDDTPGPLPAKSPSGVRLVLLGEGESRLALDASFAGPSIPLRRVTAVTEAADFDRDDELRIPDGLYSTAELPVRVRRAIGVA